MPLDWGSTGWKSSSPVHLNASWNTTARENAWRLLTRLDWNWNSFTSHSPFSLVATFWPFFNFYENISFVIEYQTMSLTDLRRFYQWYWVTGIWIRVSFGFSLSSPCLFFFSLLLCNWFIFCYPFSLIQHITIAQNLIIFKRIERTKCFSFECIF